MNPLIIFLIGVLVGWLIEWVIDWIYWRRRAAAGPAVDDGSRARVNELEQEVASYRHQLAALQESAARGAASAAPAPVHQPDHRDRLEDLKGVTADMARLLYEAGITTFGALGALRPARLRDILAGHLSQAGGEVDIVRQARVASGMARPVDDLEAIVGIGPVIARMLNQEGIFTFAELAALSADDLRRIVGDRIQQLADEDKILRQARQLAGEPARGG